MPEFFQYPKREISRVGYPVNMFMDIYNVYNRTFLRRFAPPSPYIWENTTISEKTMNRAKQMLSALGDSRSEEIMELYYRDNLSLDAIGQKYGITRERVRQIKMQAIFAIIKSEEKRKDDESKTPEKTKVNYQEFDKIGFMAYLEVTFNCLGSPFVRSLLENVVDLGVESHANRRDQLCYFLSETIPEVEFGEVAQFVSDCCLTNSGKKEKKAWLTDHPDFVH